MAKNELNSADRELLKKGIESFNEFQKFSTNFSFLSDEERRRMEEFASYWQDCVDSGKELSQIEERIIRQQIDLAEKQKAYQLESVQLMQQLGKGREKDAEIISKNAALIQQAIEYNKAGIKMDMSGVDKGTAAVIEKFTKLNGEYNKSLKKGGLNALSTNVQSTLSILAKQQTALTTINNQVRSINDSVIQAQMSAEKSLKSTQDWSYWLNFARQCLAGAKVFIHDISDSWRTFNEVTFKTGRDMGMSLQQLRGYQLETIRNTRELATAYGLTQEALARFQKQYATVTQRNVVFNYSEAETMAGMSTLMGEESAVRLIDEFDKLGGSMSAASAWGMQMQNMAMKFGLNSQKSAEALAKSFQMANRYSFKNGISGLQRMVLQSQTLRFNLEAAGAAMDKASTFEGAIDMASRMQMLGGAYAMQFSNPVQLFYEANNDAEALTNRIINTVNGKARFDRKEGRAVINPLDKAFMREMANITGIGYDELVNIANRSATNREAIKDIKDKNISKSDMEALANMSTYNAATGKFEIHRMTHEGEKPIELSEITNDMIKDIKSNVISDKVEDNVAGIYKLLREDYLKRARESQSFNENAEGMKTGIKATIARAANSGMDLTHDILRSVGGSQVTQWGGAAIGMLSNALAIGGSLYMGLKMRNISKILKNGVPINNSVGSSVGSVGKTIGLGSSGVQAASVIPGAPANFAYSGNVYNKNGVDYYTGVNTKTGQPMAISQKGTRLSGAAYKTTMANAQRVNTVSRLGGKLTKGGIGWGMAAGLLGAGIDIASDKLVESGKIKRGSTIDILMGGLGGGLSGAATGAMIGSILLTPGIGTAIGGLIGGALGAKKKTDQAAELKAQALTNESAGASVNGNINLIVSGSVKLVAPNGASSDMMRAINDPAVRAQITDIVQRELRKRSASGTSINMGSQEMQLQQGL